MSEADQLIAFKYKGFWRPKDTVKDKQVLEDLVDKDAIPWRLDGPSQAGRRREED